MLRGIKILVPVKNPDIKTKIIKYGTAVITRYIIALINNLNFLVYKIAREKITEKLIIVMIV